MKQERRIILNPQLVFDLWTPAGGIWSDWVKPVLFAHLPGFSEPPAVEELERYIQALDVKWLVPSEVRKAVVIDLPGSESLLYGLALAWQGYQPVALYNSCPHPNALVNVDSLMAVLEQSGELLKNIPLPPQATPAFLLDSNRMSGTVAPLRFDNRWQIFPQDFPSAGMLLRNKIQEVLILQNYLDQPAEALRHVLRRWQDAGLKISVTSPQAEIPPQPVKISKPSNFKMMWHQALAMMGLRHNSAGGFGGMIPAPSSG